MLSNAYFLAKFRFDTAENEPAKNLQNFAFLLPILLNFAAAQPAARLGAQGAQGRDRRASKRNNHLVAGLR